MDAQIIKVEAKEDGTFVSTLQTISTIDSPLGRIVSKDWYYFATLDEGEVGTKIDSFNPDDWNIRVSSVVSEETGAVIDFKWLESPKG